MDKPILTEAAGDKVGKAQEGGNGLVLRMPIQPFRAVELLEDAVMQHGNLVGDAEGLGLVVGDEDGGDRKFLQDTADLAGEVVSQGSVKGAERFVEEQQLRLGGEAPGQGHPLPLATGKFIDTAITEYLQPHQMEHDLNPMEEFGRRAMLHLQAEGDVLPDIFVGKERVLLKHHAEIALMRGDVSDIPIAKGDSAGIFLLKTGDQAQQGGLAGAGRAKQAEDFALTERKADVPEKRGSLVTITEVFHQEDVVGVFAHGRLMQRNWGGVGKYRS